MTHNWHNYYIFIFQFWTSIFFISLGGGDEDYGLDAYESGSSIHLVSPLTIETISTNNGGGANNHGGGGTIKSVDKDGKVLEAVYEVHQ